MYITSECIAWHAVSVTESVIIVSVNLLTIIVFMRNKNLRKRSTCLVINLTVVDMLVLGIFRYFYLFATQLHYLKMPKEKKKKNVGRDGEEA